MVMAVKGVVGVLVVGVDDGVPLGIPEILVAGLFFRHGELAFTGGVDGEVKVDDAVAAMRSRQCVGVIASGIKMLFEEGIGLTIANGAEGFSFRTRIDIDGHADGLVNDAVADDTGVGVAAKARSDDGMLGRSVAERLVGVPSEGVVAGSIGGDGMDGSRCAFAKFILVGSGHGGEVGTFHVNGDGCRAGAATIVVGNGQDVNLRFCQRHGLRGWTVGVGDHVGRLPMVGERAANTCVASNR